MTTPLHRRLALAAAVILTAASPAIAAPAPHGIEHVFIVVLENTDADEALKQPFLSSLAGKGALLTDYSGITHPSQPNYIALTSGDTGHVRNDSRHTLDVTHIGNLVEAAGLTWKSYAEGYPGNCNLRAQTGDYVRKHEPFLSYANVQRDPARCARIVDASQLDVDLAAGQLPNYALYVPDLRNDGHDTGVAFADKWLATRFGPLVGDPRLMDKTLFIVTFDEGRKANKVYTVLYGDMIAPGTVSKAAYDHYSLLRTTEDELGLGTLGRNDQKATPITGVFR